MTHPFNHRTSAPPVADVHSPGPVIAPATGPGDTSIGAAASSPSPPSFPTGEAGAPNLSTFRFRTSPCDACDRATDIRCDSCWSSGEIDCSCCECGNVYPLNEDGLCRFCNDGRYLTTVQMQAKWLCPGVLRNPETRVEL